MAVTIAEYLGMRTDAELDIQPVAILPPDQRSQSPLCPFNNLPCAKMRMKRNPKPPICSLRKTTGQFYIVCEHRLLSTSTAQISEYQKDILLEAGKVLFSPFIEPRQLAYKVETHIRTSEVGNKVHHADFILAVVDETLVTFGPRRMIVEVQGGGETGNTGYVTSHIEDWRVNPTNEVLRARTGANPIETNAWRRLQEQIFAKATTAKKSGYGFGVLVGKVIFEYINRVLPGLKDLRVNVSDPWDIAFVVYDEIPTPTGQRLRESVALTVSDTLYVSIENLFLEMAKRGRDSREDFDGIFHTLSGEVIELN